MRVRVRVQGVAAVASASAAGGPLAGSGSGRAPLGTALGSGHKRTDGPAAIPAFRGRRRHVSAVRVRVRVRWWRGGKEMLVRA